MKSKFILFAALCNLLWITCSYATETESNNTKATANKLTLNGSNSGAINPAGDIDWWKVTTTSDGQLSVTLTPKGGHYTYCQLYDNDGTTLLVSAYSSSVFTVTKDGLSPGTYFIQVFCYYVTDTSNYTISNVLTAAALTNDLEPNGTYTQANTMTLNGSITGHINYYYNHVADTTDWYKFTTTGDGLVNLQLAVTNAQYVYWVLYDGNGTTVLQSNYTSGTSSYNTDGLAAGTYYVKIYTYYSTGFATYTLSNTLTVPAQSNDAEPNGSIAQAVIFNLNSTVTGHINYFYNGQYDTYDWYKIVTTQDGMINLNFSSNNSQYVYWQLYDNDGTTYLNGNYTSGTSAYYTDGLAAGTYYVKVFTYYSNGWAPYTLTNTFTQYTNANDGLANDFAKQGATLLANATTSGHVGFRNNGGSLDLIDNWKINYTGSGALTVTLNIEPWLIGGTPYTYMQIYKDTALSPIYNNYGTTSLTASLTGLSQGYYYVKVFMYYNTQYAAYNLTPTFTQTNCVSSVTATNTHSGKNCTDSYITFQAAGGLNQLYLQLYRYGVAQGAAVIADNTGSYKFDNLSPGNYTCVGYSEGATGGCNATSISKTVIPKVTGLNATGITSTVADINWTTFSCVKYYYMQYRVLGDTKWKKKTTVGNVGTYHLTGLVANTTYEYRVAANDSLNGQTAKGKYSTISTFATLTKLSSTSTDNSFSSVDVYPNPTSSEVKVRFENVTEGKVTMKIYDVNGKLIFSINQDYAIGFNTQELDLSKLPAGIYNLQMISVNGKVTSLPLVKIQE